MPLALTWYEWFKTDNVLAAVLWVGGGATLATYAILTTRQGNPAEMASMARKAGLIGERFYTPLSFLVLAFGFGLMHNDQSPWNYGQFFVIFALAGWAASTLIGVLFLEPEASRLDKLMPTRPPEAPGDPATHPADPHDRPDRRRASARDRLRDDREAVPLAGAHIPTAWYPEST
jgi:uncharacterized membrane protein